MAASPRRRPTEGSVPRAAVSAALWAVVLVVAGIALGAGQVHAGSGDPAKATAAPPVTVAPPANSSSDPPPPPVGDTATKPLGASGAAQLRLAAVGAQLNNATLAFLEYVPAGSADVSRLCSHRDFFDDRAAALACVRYGYAGGGYRVPTEATAQQAAAAGSTRPGGAITLFQCAASATALENCTYSELLPFSKGCSPADLILLKCYGEGAIRLVDSPAGNPYQGRIQMFWAGQWHNVCTQGMDPKTAKGACRLMGYGFNASEPAITMPPATYDALNQRYKQPNLWIPRIACGGKETVFTQCGPQQVPVTDIGDATKCYKANNGVGLDAAVDCGQPPPPPPSPPAPKKDAGAMAGLNTALVLAMALVCAAAVLH